MDVTELLRIMRSKQLALHTEVMMRGGGISSLVYDISIEQKNVFIFQLCLGKDFLNT